MYCGKRQYTRERSGYAVTLLWANGATKANGRYENLCQLARVKTPLKMTINLLISFGDGSVTTT